MPSCLFIQFDSFSQQIKKECIQCFSSILRMWFYKCAMLRPPAFGHQLRLWVHSHGKSRVHNTCEKEEGDTSCLGSVWENWVSPGAIHNLLEIFQPCSYMLPLKIMLHLSRITLHFIMLILDTVSSHFKSLKSRHLSHSERRYICKRSY